MLLRKHKAIAKSLRKNLLNRANRAHRSCEAKKKIPSLKQLQEELQEIDSEFEKLFFNTKTNQLVVYTKDVYPGGQNFGSFQIRLKFISDKYSSWYVNRQIKALKPQLSVYNKILKAAGLRPYNNHNHPHQNGSNLCLGTQGNKAIGHAARNLRIADMFFIINSVLNGYSAQGAYLQIEAWKTSNCRKCHKDKEEKDLYICVRCNVILCKKCIDAICPVEGCKAGLCQSCRAMQTSPLKCKIHKSIIGRTKYKRPSSHKSTRDEKNKFNGIKGWAF
jgi:hypothetical protein